MGLFDQAKDLYKMQKQAKEVKAQLKNIHIEAEADGVVVTMTAEQHVMDVKIPEALLDNVFKLQKAIAEAVNKGSKKAQQIAAERMKGVMGGLFGGAEKE